MAGSGFLRCHVPATDTVFHETGQGFMQQDRGSMALRSSCRGALTGRVSAPRSRFRCVARQRKPQLADTLLQPRTGIPGVSPVIPGMSGCQQAARIFSQALVSALPLYCSFCNGICCRLRIVSTRPVSVGEAPCRERRRQHSTQRPCRAVRRRCVKTPSWASRPETEAPLIFPVVFRWRCCWCSC